MMRTKWCSIEKENRKDKGQLQQQIDLQHEFLINYCVKIIIIIKIIQNGKFRCAQKTGN